MITCSYWNVAVIWQLKMYNMPAAVLAKSEQNPPKYATDYKMKSRVLRSVCNTEFY